MPGRSFGTGCQTLPLTMPLPQRTSVPRASKAREELSVWATTSMAALSLVRLGPILLCLGRPTVLETPRGVRILTLFRKSFLILTATIDVLFKDLLQAHKDNGLIMDFAMGPNQGTGVPAPSNSDGLMWDLAAYNVTVPIGGTFDGELPGWGTGILQAAVTGLVTKSEEATGVQPGLPGDVSATRMQYTLAASTLEDVTPQVSKDGHLKIDFPSHQQGLNYTVFAVYMMRSHYRAQDGPYDLMENQTPPTSIAGNGSWAVDHFSELGAQTSIEFWERHILQHGTQELIEQVGNYAWEDSYEVQNNVEWTKDMMKLFEEDHGYSIAKYFPIIFHRDGISKLSTPAIWWITDEPDTGLDHIADFRDTVSCHSPCENVNQSITPSSLSSSTRNT